MQNCKSNSASKAITVGGTKVKLQAKVTYTYKETETVTEKKYHLNVLFVHVNGQLLLEKLNTMYVA